MSTPRPLGPMGAIRSPAPLSDFASFYRDEYPGSVRLAYLLTRSFEVAEDLTQEAFAVLHGRFDQLDRPGGYLRVTLVNLCHRWHRTNHRDQRRLRLVHAAESNATVGTEYLRDAIEVLPYRQRAVLVMRFWLGLSETEIAEALGCRPGTVKSLSSRAMDRLRTEIER